jgi:DNA ligase D-like protein (predicted 3'-phosphoesterase)
MSLTEYRKKRDFKKTPEPAPAKSAAAGAPGFARGSASAAKARPLTAGAAPRAGLIYVIQKHRASHLHWDLRLEEKGELLSWAVPKEPPLVRGVRRLAVRVENHALGYADFKGTIPEGEYGAGTVEIWDRGTYAPVETSPGGRVVDLHGEKLKGRYALIKLKPKDGKDKNWLFFKLKDKPE